MSGPSSVDTIFTALGHSYRRYVLDSLTEQGTMTLADLADEVAARAFEQPLDDTAEQERDRVVLSLYHKHIPMLAAARMVEYDQSKGTVGIGEVAERAMPFLSLAENESPKPA